MSYIPKYIVKRLIPEDAVKKTADGISISIVNIVSAIPAGQIPGDPVEFINIKVNGIEITPEEKQNVGLLVEDAQYTLPTLRDAGDIPIGAKCTFTFPSDQYQVGDEITVDFRGPISKCCR